MNEHGFYGGFKDGRRVSVVASKCECEWVGWNDEEWDGGVAAGGNGGGGGGFRWWGGLRGGEAGEGRWRNRGNEAEEENDEEEEVEVEEDSELDKEERLDMLRE